MGDPSDNTTIVTTPSRSPRWGVLFDRMDILTVGASFLIWVTSAFISATIISQDIFVFYKAGEGTSFLPGVTEPSPYPLFAGVLSVVLSFFPYESSALIWTFGIAIPSSFVAIFLLSKLSPTRAYWIRSVTFFFFASGFLFIAFFQRLEPVVFPFIIAAFLALRRNRQVLAGILFAVGGLLKFWTFLLAGAFLLLKKIKVFLPTGLVFILMGFSLLFPSLFLASWLTFGGGRGFQVESFTALPALWFNALSSDGLYAVGTDSTSLSVEISGPFLNIIHIFIAMLVAGSFIGIFWVQKDNLLTTITGNVFQGYISRQVLSLFGAVTVGALIVLPVLSPQYVAWIFPVIMVGLSQGYFGKEALITVLAAFLSTIVYPFMYSEFVNGEVLPLVLLTLRDVFLVFLFIRFLQGMSASSITDQGHMSPALPGIDHLDPPTENSSTLPESSDA